MKYSSILIFFLSVGFLSTAQEITMFPGYLDYEYYQDDHHITKRQLLEIMSQDEVLFADWKRSRTFSAIGISSGIGALGLLIVGINTEYERNSDQLQQSNGLLVGALALSFTSGVFTYLDLNLKKKTILRYNSKFDVSQSPSSSVNLKGKIDGNGVGLTIQF